MANPRHIIAILALTTTVSVVTASAASLGGVSGDHVGASSAAVSPCDSAVTTSYTTQGGKVTAVTVGGIADPACEGGKLELALTNSAGASVGSSGPQTITADADTADDSLTLSIAQQPDAVTVDAAKTSIVGP